MSTATEQIESAIQNLAIDEMLALHETLIARIHQKADDDGLDASFRAEIERRLREIEAGTARGVDAFEALRNM